MSPRTKVYVKNVRLVQLALRICALLGAMGMLFCVICIKKTESTVGWVLRVAPAIATVHTVYAVYHFARSSKARTPASSASYMIFAAIVDTGLVPFYVFIALMARTEYTEGSDIAGRWQTLFGTEVATYKIFYATFLLSVVDGSLHLCSLIISIYLATIFRKISKLPPDMNPLEDNLTSRVHKRNKSSIVDNRTSQVTTSTANSKRESGVEDPLISPTRNVPFMHTRTDSTADLSNTPHPHFSPRGSQTNVSAPFYDQPFSQRSSRASVTQAQGRPRTFYGQSNSARTSRTAIASPYERPQSVYEQSPAERSSRAEVSQDAITLAPTMSPSVYTNFSRAPSTRPTSARPPSTRPRSTAPTESDCNWTVHPSPPPSPPEEFKHLRTMDDKAYAPVPQSVPAWNIENFNPLELNPPTPPNAERRPMTQQRPLVPGTGNSLGFGMGKLRDYEGLRRGYGGHRVVSSGIEEGRVGGEVRMRGVSGKVIEEGRGGTWFAKSER
ncbi:MAG: hypothetical protein Q9191_001380 [Dirinaria sp. TL-2023a]